MSYSVTFTCLHTVFVSDEDVEDLELKTIEDIVDWAECECNDDIVGLATAVNLETGEVFEHV